VELAPAILPAVVDRGDERVRVGGEDALGRRAVGGELDAVGPLGLLESLGRELDEAGAVLLGRLDGRDDGGADQRNALRSFSKKPE
jgi:hypothetical protein